MMLGGVIAAHLVGLPILCASYLFRGPGALLSAGLGFAAVLAFYGLGQWLEVIAVELPGMQGMGLVLTSYAVRVTGITAALWAILSLEKVGQLVSGGWLAGSLVASVIAWVVGVVLVASRQRVPIYDTEHCTEN